MCDCHKGVTKLLSESKPREVHEELPVVTDPKFVPHVLPPPSSELPADQRDPSPKRRSVREMIFGDPKEREAEMEMKAAVERAKELAIESGLVKEWKPIRGGTPGRRSPSPATRRSPTPERRVSFSDTNNALPTKEIRSTRSTTAPPRVSLREALFGAKTPEEQKDKKNAEADFDKSSDNRRAQVAELLASSAAASSASVSKPPAEEVTSSAPAKSDAIGQEIKKVIDSAQLLASEKQKEREAFESKLAASQKDKKDLENKIAACEKEKAELIKNSKNARILTEKDATIKALESKLAASESEKAESKKAANIGQQASAKTIGEKDAAIRALEAKLAAAEKEHQVQLEAKELAKKSLEDTLASVLATRPDEEQAEPRSPSKQSNISRTRSNSGNLSKADAAVAELAEKDAVIKALEARLNGTNGKEGSLLRRFSFSFGGQAAHQKALDAKENTIRSLEERLIEQRYNSSTRDKNSTVEKALAEQQAKFEARFARYSAVTDKAREVDAKRIKDLEDQLKGKRAQ